MSFTKFDERRLLGWGDFLEEMDEKYPIDHKLKSEELNYLHKCISKGNDLQEQLNEDWHGWMSYEKYMRLITSYINSQDIIIRNIIEFRQELNKEYTKENKKCKKH